MTIYKSPYHHCSGGCIKQVSGGFYLFNNEAPTSLLISQHSSCGILLVVPATAEIKFTELNMGKGGEVM
jgi:hypothetical protein